MAADASLRRCYRTLFYPVRTVGSVRGKDSSGSGQRVGGPNALSARRRMGVRIDRYSSFSHGSPRRANRIGSDWNQLSACSRISVSGCFERFPGGMALTIFDVAGRAFAAIYRGRFCGSEPRGGADAQLAKRIGLLHDMGKAVTHEIEGTHAVIGHDLALKYGETKAVANGIGCHHYEMEALTVEGSLCSSADAVSASRPGARIEAVEQYVKRVKKLEEIAHEFPGVEKAYALQAGREVRVVVLPDMIDDDGLINLARDLKKRVEGTMEYPGKIKVTVIREKRAVEYAV